MKLNIPYTFKIAERFLIFSTIASFVCSVLSILRDFTGGSARNIINLPTTLLCLAYCLIVFLIIDIFFDENTKTANFVRLVVYFTIGCGVLTYFLRDFVNSPILFLLAPVISILYKKIFEAFFEHDGFERQCMDKNNSSLQKELYDYTFHLSEAAAGYKQNRVILSVMAAILSGFAGLAISSHITLSVFSVVLFIVYIVCFFTNLFLYSHYVREAVYSTDGFVNVFSFRPRVIFTSILIFAGAFVLALLVSSNHSPLKLSYLLSIFKFANKQEHVMAAPVEYTNDMIIEQRMNEIRSMSNSLLNEDNSSGMTFAIICGAFFGICILWFFLSPFIKRAFSKAFQNVDFRAMVRKFFMSIKEIFKKLFSKRIKLSAKTSENARRFGQEMAEYLKASKKSKEKIAELDRLTRKFMKIIDWGTAQGIDYTKNLAPAEYTAKLNNSSAHKAGKLFEKALYAKECLSSEEEKEFEQLVETVCSIYR